MPAIFVDGCALLYLAFVKYVLDVLRLWDRHIWCFIQNEERGRSLQRTLTASRVPIIL